MRNADEHSSGAPRGQGHRHRRTAAKGGGLSLTLHSRVLQALVGLTDRAGLVGLYVSHALRTTIGDPRNPTATRRHTLMLASASDCHQPESEYIPPATHRKLLVPSRGVLLVGRAGVLRARQVSRLLLGESLKSALVRLVLDSYAECDVSDETTGPLTSGSLPWTVADEAARTAIRVRRAGAARRVNRAMAMVYC